MFSFLRPNKVKRAQGSVNAYKTKIAERRTRLSNLNTEAAELAKIGEKLKNIRNQQIPALHKQYTNMKTNYIARVKSFKNRSRKNLGESRRLVNIFRRKSVPVKALANAHNRLARSGTVATKAANAVDSTVSVPVINPVKMVYNASRGKFKGNANAPSRVKSSNNGNAVRGVAPKWIGAWNSQKIGSTMNKK